MTLKVQRHESVMHQKAKLMAAIIDFTVIKFKSNSPGWMGEKNKQPNIYEDTWDNKPHMLLR